ncbi:pirin family protein [Salibacteraceae bacterium]|nr:pirin family protein [Salibacteraceae bacterium]
MSVPGILAISWWEDCCLLPRKDKLDLSTFIDHMGPSEVKEGRYMDVDQHPHVGLSTLTYLFEGTIMHRDSTGAVQRISAGDVGFMTAGKGVTHTERIPDDWRDGQTRTMHGYQVWVAMPIDKEEIQPHFQFFDKTSLPSMHANGLTVRLVAGEAFGMKSPLKVYSELFMIDVKAESDSKLDLAGQVKGEIAIVVVKGKVVDDGEIIEAGEMLISKTEDECTLDLKAHTQLLLFGGEPFPEERFLMWNFVSHSKERLEQAKQEWQSKKFPKVPGDKTYIPFP